MAANSVASGGIWPKFELIQAYIHVLVTCKNEEDSIKNEGARVATKFIGGIILVPPTQNSSSIVFSRRSKTASTVDRGRV